MDATPSRLLLSPLNFLTGETPRRSAQRPAVVHGERRDELRRARAALQPARVRAARPGPRAPRPRGDPGAEHTGAARVPLRRAARRRRAGGDEHTPELRRDRAHPQGLRGAPAAGRRAAQRARRRRRHRRRRHGRDRGHGEAAIRTSSCWPSGSPDDRPESWLEDENEPISINYTSGTTGQPKGAVYTHRGAYLQALGVAMEVGLGYDSGAPLDAPDVPLQRLVPDRGR